MKRIVYNIFCIAIILCLISCEKKENVIEYGSVYGVVADKNTGNKIRNASVELKHIGLNTTTGSDGQFEFPKVEEGKYQLFVTKSGYEDYSTDIIVKGNADPKKVDVLLAPLPPALTILDDEGNKIDVIDFGADEGATMRVFNIFNDSEDKLEWEIAFDCEWIKFSKDKGELKANAIQSISITIDRSKLAIDKNITIVHVLSNNGSKELTVKATSINVIETKDATADSHSAILKANVVRNMTPPIKEYGFVYSKTSTPTLTNGAQKISNIGTPQIGVYEMKVDNLEKEADYYVRAFAKNEDKEMYGEQIVFHTISHVPEIRIKSVTATATTITVNYTVTSDGGLPLEEFGICWDENESPTKETNYHKRGENVGSDDITIIGLTPLTRYYIRVYARNSEEEIYTETIKSTESGKPKVETKQAYTSGKDWIALTGTSYSPDNIPLKRQGICYSATSSSPTINDAFAPADCSNSTFICKLSGLERCTSYYYRAFVENEYDYAYGETYTAKTDCEAAILKGYVYDQDGNPIKNAKVGVGKSTGDYDTNYSTYYGMTNTQGYYEISFPVNESKNWKILATADNFNYQAKDILIHIEQEHQLDFNLNLIKTCDVDLGNGYWADGQSYMLFSCTQSSLAGTTTTRNMRLRNYRSVPVEWSITNTPNTGVKLSQYKGTIPANGEISVVWTFTYPTTSATAVSLNGCETGSKAYVWNWETVAGGVYVYESKVVSSSYPYNQVGVSWNVGYSPCSAACEQGVFLNIGDEQGGFSIAFCQFVVYK